MGLYSFHVKVMDMMMDMNQSIDGNTRLLV